MPPQEALSVAAVVRMLVVAPFAHVKAADAHAVPFGGAPGSVPFGMEAGIITVEPVGSPGADAFGLSVAVDGADFDVDPSRECVGGGEHDKGCRSGKDEGESFHQEHFLLQIVARRVR